jgi:hypothetical protein
VTKKNPKDRIVPALDEAIEYGLRNGSITKYDLAGIALAYNLAGIIDNAELKPDQVAKLSGELQRTLDKYGLSLYGRNEKPELPEEANPLDRLRSIRNTDAKDTDKAV